MYKTLFLALLVQFVGLTLAQFSWEIVEGKDRQLNFYENGVLTFSQDYPFANDIRAVTYDPVNNSVIFADHNAGVLIISSYDIATAETQTLVRSSDYIHCLAYDPAAEFLFWSGGYFINTFSLKSGSMQKIDGKTEDDRIRDIAVDSCSGYVYWITNSRIERARFDGSDREVVINNSITFSQRSLAIDHQTQKMYWSQNNERYRIKSAYLNGTNSVTLPIRQESDIIKALTISNDFIYWKGDEKKAIWKLPKNPCHSNRSVNVEPKTLFYSNRYCYYCQDLAAKYTINERTVENNNCERLKSLISKNLEPTNSAKDSITSQTCVDDTNAIEESVSEPTQGSTRETCDTSICQNYCFQGDCNVSAEGQAECSCKDGYSGQRCEVYPCHGYCLNDGVCALVEDEPVCQCTAGYEGERCEVSVCKDYCLQGNCSVSSEGQAECSCDAGYSGQRCEVETCHKHCLNGGICALDKEEPVCQCTAGYQGERCDVSVCKDYCLQGNCSVSAEGQAECSCNAGYSGRKCGVYACHGYCLNDGVCELDEADEPFCQCTADYEGERCDVLPESRNETAEQTSDDEAKVTCQNMTDSDFRQMLTAFNDISTMKDQINYIKSSTDKLLAENKCLKEKISQLE